MNRRQVRIPIVAMSDIAFLLLIFLMLSNIISSDRSVKITLPGVDRAEKVQSQRRINVYVSREGRVYLEDREKTLPGLRKELDDKTALNKDYIIFIFGDGDAEYAGINGVLKTLRELSLRNCVFVTKEKKNET